MAYNVLRPEESFQWEGGRLKWEVSRLKLEAVSSD
jgi:hypothetical protein